MAEQVPVSVGWALWGKQQGTRSDYSVLASSGEPLSELEFTSVLTHFVAGTPPTTERGRPESLPWVTISRVGKADQRYLGISIQDPADTVDAAGRPSTSTSYFCVPYAELDARPVSYVDLYQELREIPLPYQGGGLIPLHVPRLDPGVLAHDIERFGESVVAATAALVLSGQVSVVGAEGIELLDRLRFLDAVAALLPFGYRGGGYTAASWSDSGTRHPIRLAFAARPRENAGVIRWGTGPAAPVSGNGDAYFGLLRQIREQLAPANQPARAEQLRALVKTLADDMSPCGFDQPERAVAALHSFGLPFVVYNSVCAGTADPADVRRVFSQNRLAELDRSRQQALLAELVRTAHREPANWNVIDDWWDRVVQGDPSAMLQPMIQTVRDLLLRSAPSTAIRDYLTRGAHGGIIDPLLAELVTVPSASPPADRLTRAQPVAEHVADCVLGPAGPSGFPRTQLALAENPFVASRLLAHLAVVGQGLEAVIAWLQPPLGRVLAPFFIVLGAAPAVIHRRDIEQLADRDAGHVAALLDAAFALGRLELVLPGFAGWLGRRVLGSGSPDKAGARYWRDRLIALRPARPDAQAWLDLALMLSGEAPQFLLERRDPDGWQLYAGTVLDGWNDLIADLGRAGDEALTGRLTEYLRSGTWARDKWQADMVIALAEPLSAQGQRSRLRTTVSDELARNPEAREWPFARRWLPTPRDGRHAAGREARNPSADFDWPPSAQRPPSSAPPLPSAAPSQQEPERQAPRQAGRLRSDATPAEVAAFCAAEFRGMRSRAQVMDELDQSGVIHSGAQAEAVLGELQRILLPLSGQRPEAWEWLATFARRSADGRFGPQTAVDFRRLMIQSSLRTINDQIILLSIVAASDDRGVLGSHDKVLVQAIRALEDIRRDGKKRSGGLPGRIRSVLPGGDGGGDPR